MKPYFNVDVRWLAGCGMQWSVWCASFVYIASKLKHIWFSKDALFCCKIVENIAFRKSIILWSHTSMSTFDGLLDAECNDLYDALVSSIVHQNSNTFDFPKMPYFVAKNAKICHCCSWTMYTFEHIHRLISSGWIVINSMSVKVDAFVYCVLSWKDMKSIRVP